MNDLSIAKRLTAILALLSIGATSYAEPPVLEANFNSADNLNLQNGAQIGADSSGVSGKPGDKSYTADLSGRVPGAAGPFAECVGQAPVQNVDELTVTAWYKPRGEIKGSTTLFDAVGTTLIWDDKGFWTWRIGTKPAGDTKWYYWFTANNSAPVCNWANSGDWIFIAAVWKRSEAKVTFYQGTKSAASAMAGEKTRPEKVDPLSENSKYQRVIANMQGSAKDRPFNGDIDDVRFFANALDPAAIEKIRQADLVNEPVGTLSPSAPTAPKGN